MTKGIEFKVNPERIGFMMMALMNAGGFSIHKATYQDSTLEIIKRQDSGVPFTYAHIVLGEGKDVYLREVGLDETRNFSTILELTNPYRLPS